MQTKNRQSNRQLWLNRNYTAWSKSAVAALSLRKMRRAHARLLCAVMLTVPVMLLTGCAHNPTPPCKAPEAVTMPALHQQPGLVSHSTSVQQNIKRWEQLLTTGKVTP